MEPNHQPFGHYLRYRMEMQRDMAEQHDKNTSECMKVSGIRAAIGKLLRHIVSYYRRTAADAEPELSPACLKLISEKKTGSAPGRVERSRFSFREPRPTISGGIPSFL